MSIDPGAPETGDRAVVKLFGALLMAVGGLVVLLCGLCSLGFLGMTLASTIQSPSTAAGMLAIVIGAAAVFGGVPGLCGLAVFIWGRNLYRGRRPGSMR